MTGVTVAICCYNSAARIETTLAHLSRQKTRTGLHWEVLIIDNACTDDTVTASQSAWSNVTIAPLRIVHEPVPGLMEARHRAMRESRYEFVSFIDDDNWVDPNWVDCVYSCFAEDERIAACGGMNKSATKEEPPVWFSSLVNAYAVGKQAERSSYVGKSRGFLWGAGLSVRKTAWNDLFGCGFRSRLTGRKGGQLTAGEDSELCLALMLRGWRLYYDEALQLTHFIPSERLTKQYIRAMFKGFGRSETVLMIYRAKLDKNIKIKSSWWENCLYTFPLLLKFLIRSIFSPKIERFVNRLRVDYEIALIRQLWRERTAFDSLYKRIHNFDQWNDPD